MNQLRILALTLAVIFAVGNSPLLSGSQAQGSVEQEILRHERALYDALIKNDLSTFASYLSDDYTEIRANGRVFTKAQAVEAGKRPGGKIERYDLDELKVSVYGNTALVTGRYSRQGTAMSLAGQSFEFDEQGRFSDLWVRQQGRWLCVSNQDTAIPKQAAVTPSPSTAPVQGQSAFPVGVYSAKVAQGTWTMDFKRDGTVTVKQENFSLAPDITYNVKNDQIEISAGTTSSMCSGKGIYKWAFDGQVLTFQLVSDPACQPRQAVLTGKKFIKQ